MSLLALAWRILRWRVEKHLLTAAVVALGVALMLAAVATVAAGRNALSAAAVRYPLVVGGEVGEVPLVLGSLTSIADLPGSVDGAVLDTLGDDPRVELAVPLLGGHAVGGYPVLATSPDYLRPRARFPLAHGRVFEPGTDEVVLGSEAAAGLGADLGDEVAVEHRHAGAGGDCPLRVVGVLGPTHGDADQTLFAPLSAIHRSHAAPDHGHLEVGASSPGAGVGAILVRPRDDDALLALQEELDGLDGVQVALTGQTLRRIADQLATGGELLRVLVSGVVLMTFLALLLAVYGSSVTSIREVAVMRMLGARRLQVVGVMGAVSLAVVVAGTVGGAALGALLAELVERLMRQQLGLEASVSLISPAVLAYLGLTVGLLALAGIQPAIAAYSVSAAEALADPGGGGRATRAYLQWSTRALIVLVVAVWGLQVFATHGAEVESLPLDDESMAFYTSLGEWREGEPPPPSLAARDGQQVAIQGYMYALGDPYTVEDFYLVAINPRLPRCPFCYRSPTRWERVRVIAGGQTQDVLPGPVSVTGRLDLAPDGDNPVSVELRRLDAILP